MKQSQLDQIDQMAARAMADRQIAVAKGDIVEALRAQLQLATYVSTVLENDRAHQNSGETNDIFVHQPVDTTGKPLHHYYVTDDKHMNIKVSFEIVDRDDG